MKIMKLLASCAMVGALTAVCASGAFADAAVTATYTAADAEAETGAKVTVAVTDYAVTGDYTVLVLNKDVTTKETNAGVVENADITQIDQWNGTTTIELALPDDIADGTYYVRVGGNADGYIATTFTVGSTEKPKVLIGDVDGSGEILALDAAEIATFLADITENAIAESDVNWYAAAYCTGDNEILALDAAEIATFLADMDVEYVNTTVEIGKYGDKQ